MAAPPPPAPEVALIDPRTGKPTAAMVDYIFRMSRHLTAVSLALEALRVALNAVRADPDIGLPPVPPFNPPV